MNNRTAAIIITTCGTLPVNRFTCDCCSNRLLLAAQEKSSNYFCRTIASYQH
jgi:hypothetical protein